MNRATRDKFAATTDLTKQNSLWETAPEVFAKLNADFGPFDIDLTADAERALCPTWFGPGSPFLENALTGTWGLFGSRGFSNPPYGPFVPRLLAVARAEAMTVCGATGFASTLLLPNRANASFRAHILGGASELLYCDKRLIFYEHGAPRINPKTGKADGALFDSIVVRFLPGHVGPPRVGIWEVPVHGQRL